MAKTIIGTVVSDRNDKTITVLVNSRRSHPLYGKQYTVSKKFRVHDEENQASEGDLVEIIEGRPVSKTKSWRLKSVVEKSKKLDESGDK